MWVCVHVSTYHECVCVCVCVCVCMHVSAYHLYLQSTEDSLAKTGTTLGWMTNWQQDSSLSLRLLRSQVKFPASPKPAHAPDARYSFLVPKAAPSFPSTQVFAQTVPCPAYPPSTLSVLYRPHSPPSPGTLPLQNLLWNPHQPQAEPLTIFYCEYVFPVPVLPSHCNLLEGNLFIVIVISNENIWLWGKETPYITSV